MRGLIAALIAIVPLAVLGQHQGHTMPTTKKPAVKSQTAKKQITKKTTTKKKVTTKRRTTTTKKSSNKTKQQADPHQGHGVAPTKQPTAKTPAKQPAKQPVKQSGHQGHGDTPAKQPTQQPTKQSDPHQGHTPTTPPTTGGQQQPQQPHQGHGGTTAPIQQGQNPTFQPAEPFPQYDKRGWPKPVMDDLKYSFTLFERLEYLPSGGGGELAWDVLSWHGGDYRRIWLKSEGEQSFLGDREGEGDVEIHMGRLIKPFVDLLTGVRLEGAWGDRTLGRVSVGAGFQTLQPYVVESEAFVFLSQSGQIYFNGTFSRDFYLTQRVVLQPRVETNFALNSDRRFGSEAGLQDFDLSLRVRYEIRRELAPYIGVSGRWLFGGTASAARSRGEEASRYRFIVGVRMWF